MNLKTLFIMSFMALSLSACGSEPTEKRSPEEQAKIDAAIEEIKSEPRVKDFYLEDINLAAQWNIGVIPSKDEYGYANYICETLNGHGLAPEKQVVRIVNIVMLTREDIPPKKASVMRIKCDTRKIWPE